MPPRPQSSPLDVVDATAEALPLELLSDTNKELTAQISHYEQLLSDRAAAIADQRKRLQFMQEHLSNVRAECVHTQSLCEGKTREAASEQSMCRVLARECARLQQQHTQLTTSEQALRDRATELGERAAQATAKLDAFRAAMAFNEDELAQWAEARAQKADDELAVAQYSKQDEATLRALRRDVEQREATVRRTRARLAEALTATREVQRELDACAASYAAAHDDRGSLLDEWARVVQTMAQRDGAIRAAAEQYAEGAAWLRQRRALRDELDTAHERARGEADELAATLRAREAVLHELRGDVLPQLQRRVDDVADEVAAARETVRRGERDTAALRARLRECEAALQTRAEACAAAAARRDEAAAQLQQEMAAAADMQQQSALVAQLRATAARTDRALTSEVARLQKAQFAANEALHTLRERQSGLLADVAGAQAQGKNLTQRVHQLDAESFALQGVLYQMEYAVQQMQKKVRRASGERSEEEKRELQQRIALLQSTLDELTRQQRSVHTQVKRVREELRQAALLRERLQAQQRSAAEAVLEADLACAHSEAEARVLSRQREDRLIALDTLELQLQRLQRAWRHRSDALVDATQRKQQLAADVAEREAAMALHQASLRAEGKLAEEQRRRLAGELLERQKRLTALRHRHGVLVGRLDPAQARLTQAQRVMAAAREREALQHRGDGLDRRVLRLERQARKLAKTLAVLRASNSAYKHKFDTARDGDAEVQTRDVLQSRLRALKATLSRRTLDGNDCAPALQAKHEELAQLRRAHDARAAALHDAEQAYAQLQQSILDAREATIRYTQASARARGAVDAATRDDVALVEAKDRLTLAVHRLLQCLRNNSSSDDGSSSGDSRAAAYKDALQRLRAAHVPVALDDDDNDGNNDNNNTAAEAA